jgi:hypothetical protein
MLRNLIIAPQVTSLDRCEGKLVPSNAVSLDSRIQHPSVSRPSKPIIQNRICHLYIVHPLATSHLHTQCCTLHYQPCFQLITTTTWSHPPKLYRAVEFDLVDLSVYSSRVFVIRVSTKVETTVSACSKSIFSAWLSPSESAAWLRKVSTMDLVTSSRRSRTESDTNLIPGSPLFNIGVDISSRYV